MAVQELGHVVLYVRNIERSLAFYRDALGLVPLHDGPVGFPAVALSGTAHRTHHELLLIEVGEDAAALPPGRRVGLYHIGFKVGDSDDELRATLAHLQAAGVRPVGASDHTVSHSLYLQDPDGNEVELYVDVPGVDWRNDPSLLMSPVKPLTL